MPKVKIPEDLHVEAMALGPNTSAIGWTADGRKYHFWVRSFDASPRDEVLHSNPIVETEAQRQRNGGYRAHSLTAKKWAPLIAAVVDVVRDNDMIEKARHAVIAKREAAEAARLRAIAEDRALRFDRATLQFPEELRGVLLALPEEKKAAIVAYLEG